MTLPVNPPPSSSGTNNRTLHNRRGPGEPAYVPPGGDGSGPDPRSPRGMVPGAPLARVRSKPVVMPLLG